jgi:hypothetical protein
MNPAAPLKSTAAILTLPKGVANCHPSSIQTSGDKQKLNCDNTEYLITFTPLG